MLVVTNEEWAGLILIIAFVVFAWAMIRHGEGLKK
jgi:hypothetical protein